MRLRRSNVQHLIHPRGPMPEIKELGRVQVDTSVRMLTIREVIERIGVCKTTIYAMIRDHQFPKPIRLRARSSRWLESEIADWCRAQIQRRDEGG